MSKTPDAWTRGHTMIELMTAIAIVGILAALAVPSFFGRVAAHRTRATIDRLAGDLHVARMHALQQGRRVELRFTWDARRACVVAYEVREVGSRGPPLRAADVAASLPGGCLSMNNARRALVFNARGFPHGVMARTVVARSGRVADTLVVSQLGRLLREY